MSPPHSYDRVLDFPLYENEHLRCAAIVALTSDKANVTATSLGKARIDSLVPERLDRVEAGGAARREVAEGDADACRHQEGERYDLG